jgi:hypothetical protein
MTGRIKIGIDARVSSVGYAAAVRTSCSFRNARGVVCGAMSAMGAVGGRVSGGVVLVLVEVKGFLDFLDCS